MLGARTYYWGKLPNFGDLLNVPLLEHFGITPEWVKIEDEPDLVVAGSVLEMLHDGWSGIIAGAGMKRDEPTRDLSRARILGVRGPLSARAIHGDVAGAVIGDPGLLAPFLLDEMPERKHLIGIVPHWSDDTLADHYPGTVIPTMTSYPMDTLRAIAECDSVITSSLHGLIIADALGIPAQPELCKGVRQEGGSFKLLDYSGAIGVPFVEGRMRLAPREPIEKIQTELAGMFEDLRRMLWSRVL